MLGVPEIPDSIVRAQAAYRRQIVEQWQIREGETILEIGCGQGDLTVAIAEAAGEHGRVTAIDIADSDYGAPMTLGEATAEIARSALGSRIEFRLGFDINDPDAQLPAARYDGAAWAHSSWYFDSRDEVVGALGKVRQFASRLYFAEWDLTPAHMDQLPHLLAVLVQAQLSAQSKTSFNIQTIQTRDMMKENLAAAGWWVVHESTLDTSALQDADWEINLCLQGSEKMVEALASSRARSSLLAQIETLRTLARPSSNVPLPAYCLIAE